MFNKIILSLAVALSPYVVFAHDGIDNVIVNRKIITNTDRVRVIGVQVETDYYWAVNKDALREKLQEDFAEQLAVKVSGKVTDELIQIIEEIIKELSKKNGQQPPTDPKPPEDPTPDTPTQPEPSDLDEQVLKVFRSTDYKCNTCHNEDKHNKNVQLTERDKLANMDDLMKFRVHYAVLTNHMPPGTKKLTDAEVNLIGKWANSKFDKE